MLTYEIISYRMCSYAHNAFPSRISHHTQSFICQWYETERYIYIYIIRAAAVFIFYILRKFVFTKGGMFFENTVCNSLSRP